MIVYVFKFSRNTAENGANNNLASFLQSLVKYEGDVFNYKPSKELIVVGVQISIYEQIREWLRNNVDYAFEFEEHTESDRSITQFNPKTKSFSVQYLLPLFTPESYLEL